MLEEQSYFANDRPQSVIARSLKRSTTAKSKKEKLNVLNQQYKKEKVNAVSKASLAMLDPRHAMGMDIGTQWCDSPTVVYNKFEPETLPKLAGPIVDFGESQWTVSPTPTLEAFNHDLNDESYASNRPSFDVPPVVDTMGGVEMDREPSSSMSSVFEDDRDGPEKPTKRFLSRKSHLPNTSSSTSNAGTFPSSFPPPLPLSSTSSSSSLSAKQGKQTGKPSKPNGTGSSSIARFFNWKKKEKQNLSLLPSASKSTSDLLDLVPMSAPPFTTAFDLSIQTHLPRHDSEPHNLGSPNPNSSPSLPSSPVRKVRGSLPRQYGAQRDTVLLRKQSMPALRVQSSVAERKPSSSQRDTIISLSPVINLAPALPPLPANFGSSSPILPMDCGWNVTSPTEEDNRKSWSSNARPISRVVSSTGRGVPSPRLGTNRRGGFECKSLFATSPKVPPPPPLPPLASSLSRSQKRKSLAQQVVDGLLSKNHGHEEPAIGASGRRPAAEVKAVRRRSRSVDSRLPPSLSSFGSPPTDLSPVMVADVAIFPSLLQHTPSLFQMTKSHFSDTDIHVTSGSPRQRYVESFSAQPDKNSNHYYYQQQQQQRQSNRVEEEEEEEATVVAVKTTVKVAGGQLEGEMYQARRVNLTNQRARAVAVSSPMLLGKSPRIGQVPPTVTIMPPTPDLGHSATNPDLASADKIDRFENGIGRNESHPQSSESVTEEKPSYNNNSGNDESAGHRSHPRSQQPSSPPLDDMSKSQRAVLRNWAKEPTVVDSPESVYSPQSVYSPSSPDLPSFSSGYDDDVGSPKLSQELVGDAGRGRTSSVTSDLSEVSSSSGAFAFSRTMSSTSLNSGGTFSSASSVVSDSPQRPPKAMRNNNNNVDGSVEKLQVELYPAKATRLTSSASLNSAIHTSTEFQDAELNRIQMGRSVTADNLHKYSQRSPYRPHLVDQNRETEDCEALTPTLASCKNMTSSTVTSGLASRTCPPSNRLKLDLDMDIQDLADQLGLGRLVEQKKTNAFPPKPPKSLARRRPMVAAAAAANATAATTTTTTTGTANSVSTGRPTISPLTPPRSPAKGIFAINREVGGAATGDVASHHIDVPSVPGSLGLGLHFGNSTSTTRHDLPSDNDPILIDDQDSYSGAQWTNDHAYIQDEQWEMGVAM